MRKFFMLVAVGLLSVLQMFCSDNPADGGKTGGEPSTTIDLSAFNTYAGTDSAEASPYAGALARYGDSVYVACQRLKNLSPADVSLIVVVDTRTDKVVGSIPLNKKNPVSMDVFGDKLLVSSAGDYSGGAATGGVELIDLTNRQNTGVAADGGEFSGHIGNLVFVSADKAYVCAYDAEWNTEVVEINPAAKTVGAKINGITSVGGLAYDGRKLYAGETGFGVTAGVAVIDPNTNVIDTIIPTGMPPAAIVSTVNYIAVNTNDYTAANFETISAESYTVTANIIPGLHTDCAMRAYGNDVYILERMGKDNVIKYGGGTTIFYQKNIGTGLNIQDIAIVSPAKAYITSHEKSYLIIIDPATGTRN